MLTQTEIEIIRMEYEHQEHLSSAITSNKSFVGGMAGIAAFVVLEWFKTNPKPGLAIALMLASLAAGSIFLWLSWGQKYRFPANPEDWIEWRSKQPAQSESELRENYWQRMLATTAEHRALNRRAQTAITWAGTLSALSILAVLVDTIGRSIFS